MIAIGYSFCNEEQRDTILLPGIHKSISSDEKILILEENGKAENASIFPIYNKIIERVRAFNATGQGEVEFLVLLHTDVEIRDLAFVDKVRSILRSMPTVAVIGCEGSDEEGDLHRWNRRNFGWVPSPHFPHFGEDRSGLPPIDEKGRAEAVTIDGLLIILSPWAIANLRFDEENFSGWHGYDADICMQARQKGMRVLVQEFDLIHHTRGGYTGGGYEEFEKANRIFMNKWFPAPVTPVTEPETESSKTVLFICPIFDAFPVIIASLMAQTSPHWRLLLIDDNPASKWAEASVQAAADPRITYVKRPRMEMYGHPHRQWALQEIAAGRLYAGDESPEGIVITNADNYYLPPFVAKMTPNLTASKETIATYCGSMMHNYIDWKPMACALQRGLIDGGGVMVRREAALEVGWRSFEHSSDWTYFSDLIAKFGSDRWARTDGLLFIHN